MIHRYYSAVRLLGNVRARRTAFAFSRRSDDQLLFRHFRGLPVLVHGISRRAWGLRLRRADRQLAILLPVMLPSSVADCVGALIANFRSSIPSPSVPLFTLHRTLHSVRCKTRGRVDRYSFLVRLFHPLSHAGLSRRTTTFFSRHGFRSWLSSSTRMVSRPTRGTNLRRIASSVSSRTVQRARPSGGGEQATAMMRCRCS